jgi:hypothetical protein
MTGGCGGAMQPRAATAGDGVRNVGLLWRQAHLQALQRPPGGDLRARLPRERLQIHL